MDDIKRKAALHIERVYELKRQLGEVEELQDAIAKYGSKNIEIGIPMGDYTHRVEMLKDLGITRLQEEFKNKLIAELHIRKEVLEMTLNQLIGGNE